jgi:hypothetical protein
MAALAALRVTIRALPVTSATAIACAVVRTAGWRGQDYPAALLRISVARNGNFYWNPQWFGGHPTLGYSALFPLLGTLLTAATLGLLATTGAVAAFELLVRGRPRATIATTAFAVGMVSNLIVGRLPFALGFALSVGCVAVLGRSRVAAGCLALLASLSSPVAALFLVIAIAGWIWAERAYIAGALIAAAALAPALVLSLLSGTGGDFPFPFPSLVWCLGLCAVVALAWRAPPIRIACVVYAVVCIAAFVVPTPLGGNVGRLPLLVTVPLVLLADPRRLRPLLLLVPVVLGWQTIEVVQVASASIADPSITPDYYDGVLRYLHAVPGPVRVEIPATTQHWEAVYVGATVEMARGWERQLDRRLNPEFYDRDRPLDAARYHRWLLHNGVSYVALPDTSFDSSSQREAQLVRHGLDYLHPVYRDAHWIVYRVAGASALLEGPGRLVSADGRRIEFDAHRPGQFTLRVRSFAVWHVDAGNACTGTSADDWLTVDAATAGRIVLTQQDPLLALLNGRADQSCQTAARVAVRS